MCGSKYRTCDNSTLSLVWWLDAPVSDCFDLLTLALPACLPCWMDLRVFFESMALLCGSNATVHRCASCPAFLHTSHWLQSVTVLLLLVERIGSRSSLVFCCGLSLGIAPLDTLHIINIHIGVLIHTRPVVLLALLLLPLDRDRQLRMLITAQNGRMRPCVGERACQQKALIQSKPVARPDSVSNCTARDHDLVVRSPLSSVIHPLRERLWIDLFMCAKQSTKARHRNWDRNWSAVWSLPTTAHLSSNEYCLSWCHCNQSITQTRPVN